MSVPVKQVERVSERIGLERLTEREAQVSQWEQTPLAARETAPATAAGPPPAVVVVEMDGGRLQIRDAAKPEGDNEGPRAAADQTPVESEPAAQTATPVSSLETPSDSQLSSANTAAEGQRRKSRHWREDKVGCLLSMTSEVSETDPCPEIPAVFLDPLKALKLAQEVGKLAETPQGTPFARTSDPIDADAEQAAEPTRNARGRPGAPELQQRVVVASRANNQAFGVLLAAAVWSLGWMAAARRAFVADGAAGNWTVHKRWFPRFEPILDFVHALTYVYAAAMAGRKFADGWPVYKEWIQWVWSGQVSLVIAALTTRLAELAADQTKDGPRKAVEAALSYLENNQEYMHYDEYRRQGLPLMSSYVESTVKQIGRRVKGTEKFWSERGAEPMLQLRADYLSDTEPMEDFWKRREKRMDGHRRYRKAG